MSLPYIYHQSPVYPLPCLSRPGGPHRRAEPQYKFVEEIITETTREIEMSEFEETGSEETEVGKDEQECTKRNRQGCEEEEEHNKDSGEEESEQMSDSQQNQVGEPLNGGDDVGGGSPGEVEDNENGQSRESEPGRVEPEEDTGLDKSSQSKVLLGEKPDEKENEQQDEAAESAKGEDVDLSPEADELKPGVTVECEPVSVKEEDQKESFVSVQVQNPVDETSTQVSTESEKAQELSSAVQVKDKKTTDFTTESKNLLSTETGELSEKAQVTSSTTIKSQGKENDHAGHKGKNECEDAKAEVVNRTKDTQHDSNKSQDEELPQKSNAAVSSLPEAKDQKAKSGDKTGREETTLPNEKTNTNAEFKELDQKGIESSQTQKPELTKGSEEINDPQGKPENVESRKSDK